MSLPATLLELLEGLSTLWVLEKHTRPAIDVESATNATIWRSMLCSMRPTDLVRCYHTKQPNNASTSRISTRWPPNATKRGTDEEERSIQHLPRSISLHVRDILILERNVARTGPDHPCKTGSSPLFKMY